MSSSQQKAKKARQENRQTSRELENLKKKYLEDIAAVLDRHPRHISSLGKRTQIEEIINPTKNELQAIKSLIHDRYCVIG